MKCTHCKKVTNTYILAEPGRHLTSPNGAGFTLPFCDRECLKAYNKGAYSYWAELDRNASDSTCFQHDHWEKDAYGRKIRVGTCIVTGQEVRVEPLQPGDNSGQPSACYEHFVLR